MFIPSLALELREKIEAGIPEGRVVPAHTEYEHYYKDSVDGTVYPSVTTKTSLLSRKFYKTLAANKAVESLRNFLLHNPNFTPEEFTEACEQAKNAHVVDLEQAGQFGTDGHELVDRYTSEWIKTGERPQKSILEFAWDGISNEGKCVGLGASMFFDDYTVFPILSEKRVLSKKYKYAGTLDNLSLIGEVYKNRVGDVTCKHTWFEKGKDKVSCVTCGRQEKLILTLLDLKSSNQIYGRGDMSKVDYTWQCSAYGMALKEMCGVNPKQYLILRADKNVPKYEVGVIVNPREGFKGFLAINQLSDYVRSSNDPIVPLVQKKVITL